MSSSGRIVLAILAAVAVVLVAGWLDSGAMHDFQRREAATFDLTPLAAAMSVGSIAVAGAVLLLATVAWRSRSALVGAIYAVAGAFLGFLPMIVLLFAAGTNDTPPLLPTPIASAVGEVYFRSTGPLNAVGIIGGGMLLVGLLVLGRSIGGRSVGRVPQPLIAGDGQPIRP